MLPWTQLGSATIPGDGGEMRLSRRGDEFSIRVASYELMNSRVHGSEDALAELVAERLRDPDSARVLIGGLGMGFTLAAMLARLGRRSSVVVAELVPEVLDWNRGVMAQVNGAALKDPRASVRIADVAAVIGEAKDAWDAIVLDVDNGPAAITAKGNNRLYGAAGLRSAHDALRKGGVLAIWSAGEDPAFTRALRRAGFETAEHRVRGREGNRGPRFLIWLARR
jgi:spermidine synthase